MKTAFCFVALFVLGIVQSAGVMADNNEDVYNPKRLIFLLIGQSNMGGRAPIEAADKAALERCELFNADREWEAAKNPLNRYSRYRKDMGMQRLNPGYTFAKQMAAWDETAVIGLVVSARGGTNIDEWERGDHLYEEAVARTLEAKRTGRLAGVLWHQGEANRDDTDYIDKVKVLIGNLREDLGVPALPFVAGQIHDNEDWAVNKQIAGLPLEVPNTAFVSSSGLVTFDNWHFDTASMREFGERYAVSMQPLIKKP